MKPAWRLRYAALALGATTSVSAGEVTLELRDLAQRGASISFAVPIAKTANATTVRVFLEGGKEPLAGVRARPVLSDPSEGAAHGAYSWLVEIPAPSLGAANRVRIAWGQGGAAAGEMKDGSPLRIESSEAVEVVDYSIEKHGTGFRLAVSQPTRRVILSGWEPATLAIPPAGYLASTGLFGELVSVSDLEASPRLRAMRFLSDNLRLFGLGALYDEGYRPSAYPGKPGDPGSAAVVDLSQVYEAWLYDRCATYLLGYAHSGELRFYRHGLRACSFYASKIDGRGFLTLKTNAQGTPGDAKYSHVRGLYFYYALTGDESALEAGRRIARMWLDDPHFVKPYRQGRARGPDKLWTERQLAHALESLVYGYLLTGDSQLLSGARELFEAAWRHITAPDAAHLKAITGHALAPQPCLVHASGQHEGSPPAEPFCSPWMSSLLVDPLLRYQTITGDSRVDEVFLQLGRYLRDTATTYFYGNPLGDTFFTPRRCYRPAAAGQPVRTLIPAYGAARRVDGSRYLSSQWDDFDHCSDATALSAAALRALRRLGGFDRPGPHSFRTEGESLLAMHNELAHCALTTFRYSSRTNRDPRNWKSAQLAKGLADPEWIVKNKIGFPSHAPAPLRKLSWWFNGSLLQFRLLDEAGVTIDTLRPGTIQPAECR